MRAFRRRARMGEVPALEMAIWSGERSTTAGRMKEHKAGASATFTGIRRARQSAETARLTSAASVAAITRTGSPRACSG